MLNNTDTSLAGLSVLVTRPRHQQRPFIKLLNRYGIKAIPFACIEIVTDAVQAAPALAEIERFDTLIFTSVNAVNCAFEARAAPWPISNMTILAIGPATAAKLAELSMPVSFAPVAPYTSEALLSLPHWNSNNSQKVAIIKGTGGRTDLQSALSDSGASIEQIDVYRRIRPAYGQEGLESVFLNSRPDIVTITSNESLSNLVALAGDRFCGFLLNLPLVVNSTRGAQLAYDLGFQSHVLVAPVPGDQGQLDAIKLWNQTYRFKL